MTNILELFFLCNIIAYNSFKNISLNNSNLSYFRRIFLLSVNQTNDSQLLLI